MIYIKSALAGIVAVFAAATLTLFIMGIYVWVVFKPAENEAIGWDPISLSNPLTWLVVIGIFLAGFFWEFRRIKSK